MSNSSTYTFWQFSGNGTVSINVHILNLFLTAEGFGNYQSNSERTSQKTLFRNNKGILEIHSADTIKRWLLKYIDTNKSIKESQKLEILDKISKMSISTFANYFGSLKVYSEDADEDQTQIKLFRDDAKNCYISFQNGVVHINKDKIELLDRSKLKSKGCIWETSVRKHQISLLSKDDLETQSLFKDYVTYALKRNIEPKLINNNIQEGTNNNIFINSLDAFETAYGYLIHSYNPPDETKLVVFVDFESTTDRTEGGNGKSVVMDTIKFFKNTAFVDGKSFRKSLNESARFNFSNVKLDTGFVFINDLNPDFDLTQMFSIITDDMQIEGKGINKIIIPKEKKPKMGVTTNYVITGIGNSYERRQHIVEFGNFWNRCGKKKIKPQDIIGKLIGEGFDTDDWNKFYNYGFYCIQKYLRNGLIGNEDNSYKKKALQQIIEGVGSSGEVVDWIDDWICNRRVAGNFHQNGISIKNLYEDFCLDNPLLKDNWNIIRFHDAVYRYTMDTDGIDYNPHKASNGTSRIQRRWRVGSRGKQEDWIKIVSENDLS